MQSFLVLPSVWRKPSLCRNLHSHTLLKLTTHHQVMSNKFSYLGSTMHSNVSQEDEIFIRLGKASTTDRVWKNTHHTTKTKVRYEACNSSILLFGAECWTTYRYLRCLRSLLGITWEDKMTNEELFRIANFGYSLQNWVRWAGHVNRMPKHHIPHTILHSVFREGTRSVGRPKLRFKDVLKRGLVIWI